MSKTENKKFVAGLLDYFKTAFQSGANLSGIKVHGRMKEHFDNEFRLTIDGRLYSLYLNIKHYRSNSASFINLRDESPEAVSYSPVQYTLSPSNFKVNGDHFELIQNRGITISRGQEGLRDQFFTLMYEHGFNRENIICSGSLSSPDWQVISKDFFKWLRTRLRVKKKLEGDYRNIEDEELNFAAEGDKILKGHIAFEQSLRNTSIVRRKKMLASKKGALKCECCSFDFAVIYGAHGLGYIECHHTNPIATGARITKLQDLALVCANCHRMLHRLLPRDELPTVKDLKRILKKKSR